MLLTSASPAEKIHYVLELLEHKAAISPKGGRIKFSITEHIALNSPLQNGDLRAILEKLEQEEKILTLHHCPGQLIYPRGTIRATKAIDFSLTLTSKFPKYVEKFKKELPQEVCAKRDDETEVKRRPLLMNTSSRFQSLSVDKPEPHKYKQGVKEVCLRFDGMTRQITLNDCFLISQPIYDSENYRFFDYIWSNPNRSIELTELNKKLEDPLKKSLSKIVENLNFKGALKDAFFKINKTSVYFTPSRTVDELVEAGLYPLRLFSTQNTD